MSEPFVAPPESFVETTIVDKVGIITLKNPAKRNALSEGLLDGITDALHAFAAEGARVVVLRADAGTRVWSAGHDISELPRGGVDPLRYADPLERTLREIRSFPMPVIAMVHGSVWGGAFDLVLSCDMIVADSTATFAITPVNLGLPYNTTGLLHFLGRLPLNLIKEMFFTASPIKADVAMQWGVVNHLVPEDQLETFTLDIAHHMATKAPLAVAVIKEQLRVLTDFQPIAAQVFERIQDMRRTVYESADYQEGISAFEEKRKPVFRGH
ncbi:methylmalonyl-CoA decarboxylase [Pseudoxanthobacter sp.]|uniref:methylmalonyl-CoA decarboxylase n=1 Tax=Pseudoxanthobacter sp. TaxID=1925742 RepID=UPI002FE3BC91